MTCVGQAFGFASAIEKFGLSWPLEDRIKTQFLPKVPAKNEKAGFLVRLNLDKCKSLSAARLDYDV